METIGENLEVCQGLINTRLLGESEGSSGPPFLFLGSPMPKSSRTEQAIQLSIYTSSIACFSEAEANITELKFYSLVAPFSTSGEEIYIFAELTSFSVLQMIGPGYHFHSLYWKNWRGNGGLVEYEFSFLF